MAQLIKHDKLVSEHPGTNGALALDNSVDSANDGLVPLAEWTADSGDGLILQVDAEPTAEHTQAPLIAIEFPAFNDGRGLSLAVLLRTRLNYTGELRAVGDVHPDMLHYMKRCGFDSYVIPEGRSAKTALAVLAPYTDYYQASAVEPRPPYRRIRRSA